MIKKRILTKKIKAMRNILGKLAGAAFGSFISLMGLVIIADSIQEKKKRD